ncbi:MAG: starch-binding protein [Prevotella sp.]|nr:starch-binding protein [Prevotella sp.]
MKKIYTILWMLTISVATMAQGWPEKYEGVMLQGFYWDGYADAQWTNLESQADELSQFFSLIWVPNSGKTSSFYHNSSSKTMGYDPCFWLDHNTCFGTEAQLRSMINTFKAKGTGIIEDVVINHKNGLNTWVDFPNEEKGTYKITWDNDNFSGICKTDECNSHLSDWATGKYAGKKATGANDTGDNFDGFRDLDHTNATVQQNVKTYLDFLMKDLGYAGFRYDMVKGFSASYIGIYNKSAIPTYSVGEYWDGDVNKVKTWIDGTDKTSAAFDFPMKYKINGAFGGGKWNLLKEAFLANNTSYSRYAVTFVDNHDTYREAACLNYNICAANAYILTMPGTPCLFLPHWKAYKGTLKKLIEARKAAGINNQSTIQSIETSEKGLVLKVKGDKGTLMLVTDEATINEAGYQLAVEGVCFKLYASSEVDLAAVAAITETDAQQEPTTVPECCVVNEGETCAFFEVPAFWDMSSRVIKCWRWDKQYNYTGGSWPGVTCTKVGNAHNGNAIWKWTFKESDKKAASGGNEGIIFNNALSNNDDKKVQTDDLDFQNTGYYTLNGMWKNVLKATTGIQSIINTTRPNADNYWYNLNGLRLSEKPTSKGLYIHQGKKVVIK